MSGEEMNTNNTEAAESTDTTDVTDSTENSEASTAEVSLASVHEMSDEELDVFLASDMTGFDSDDDDSDELDIDPKADLNADDDGDDDGEDDDAPQRGTLDDLFKPLKANGREMKIESVEEARRLMQQGIDYSKNMQEFSPFKKAMKLLKSRDALDPEKLSFLLDVSEGKPEAIAKLLKDSNLDPYDIDVDSGDSYVSEYEDTETGSEILEMLDRVSPSAKDTTLTILTDPKNSWDEASKQAIIANAQQAIPILTKQMESGQFDIIMSVVTKRRALGELPNMGDLDAYNMIGRELAAQGKLGVPNTPNESTTSKRNLKQQQNVQSKRQKAAGAPRKAPNNVPTAETFNPATASDAEVEKFLQNHMRNAAG